MVTNNRSDDYYQRQNHVKLARDDVTRSELPGGVAPGPTAPNRMNTPSLSVQGSDTIEVTLAGAPPDGGSAITSYDIRYLKVGVSWVEVLGITSPHNLTGLDADTSYEVQSRANNAIGSGQWSASAVARTDAVALPPDRPAAPIVTGLDYDSIRVTSAPVNDNGSPITSTNVRYSETDGSGWTTDSDVTSPHDINGLNSGTVYYVQTQAVNAVGAGAWSPSGSGSTIATTAPDKMAPPALAVLSKDSIRVTYDPNTANGGSAITQIDMRYSTINGSSWVQVNNISSPEDISNLLSSTLYYVQTRAINAVGTGAWSNSASAQTLPDTATVPEPMAVGNWSVATGPAANQIVFTIIGPPSDGGSPITDYEYAINGSWSSLGATSGSVTVSAAAAGQLYNTMMRAVNSIGSGNDSDVKAVTSGVDLTVPDTMLAPTVSATGQTTATVVFAAPPADGGSPITGYKCRWREGGGGWTTIDPATSPVNLTGLTPDTLIEAQTLAFNAVGDGLWSPSGSDTTDAIPATAPSQMSAPSVVADSDSQATATFAAPPPDGGSPITEYKAHWSEGSGGWTLVDPATSPLVLTGLTRATVINVETAARNAVGDGPWSPTGSATTDALPPGQMGAPTVTGVSSTSINIARGSFNADDGGATVTGYDYEYRAVGSGTWLTPAGSGTTITVTGLNPGTDYEARNRAINAIGAGAWSDVGSGSTLPAVPSVISISNWDAVALTGTLNTDMPNNGNLHWAKTLDSVTLTADGAGGWSGGAVIESGTEAIGADGSGITVPTTDDASGNFRIHVYQRNDENADSNVATEDYAIVIATVPATPTAPTVTATGTSTADVTLPSDPDDGGSPITSRNLLWRQGGGAETSVDGITSPHNLTGLTPDTLIEARWAAENAVGEGSFSAYGSDTTDPAAASSVDILGTVKSGDSSATQTFTMPSMDNTKKQLVAIMGRVDTATFTGPPLVQGDAGATITEIIAPVYSSSMALGVWEISGLALTGVHTIEIGLTVSKANLSASMIEHSGYSSIHDPRTKNQGGNGDGGYQACYWPINSTGVGDVQFCFSTVNNVGGTWTNGAGSNFITPVANDWVGSPNSGEIGAVSLPSPDTTNQSHSLRWSVTFKAVVMAGGALRP